MKDEKIKEAEVVTEETRKRDADIKENRPITFLSYLGFLCLVPLLAKRESAFAQFHAKQGLILLIAWIVGGITTPIGIGFIINAGVVILSVIGLINVNDGKMKDLPLVGEWAKKINI